MLLSFAEWRPDVAALNSSYTADVSNVLCADGFYIPFASLVGIGPSLPTPPTGGFTGRSNDGQIVLFAGTATKLWRLDNTTLTWVDISVAGGYNSTVDERWQFAQFGNYIVAVNVNDKPQVYEIGVSSKFADLGGNPPKSRLVAACGDFLVLGNLASNPSSIHWSALNDITGWTPGTNNSDYQTFPDGGPVIGISPVTNPVIVQRSAIRFGTFVPGSLEVFTFQKVHDGRGAAARYSVCSRSGFTFFADDGGFFQVGVDGGISPIGLEIVDRTVFSGLSNNDIGSIVGAVDPFYSRVYWSMKADGASDYNRLLIYDWQLQRWSQALTDTGLLFPLAASSLGDTLEGLDSVSASLDSLPASLDSIMWKGGQPIMAAFDLTGKLAFFSGLNAEATITTQEMGDTAGGVTRVTEVVPAVDTLDCGVSIGARFRRNDSLVWSNEARPSSNTGIIRKNSRSRFHSFKLRIPEGVNWTRAQGIDVKSTQAGLR